MHLDLDLTPIRLFLHFSQKLLLASLFNAALAGTAACSEAMRIADNVYAIIGTPGEVTAANGGRVANRGFIVGTDSVTVIDTGTTYRQGKEMLQAIAGVTSKPVRLVILTHAVQEFIFGSAAFDELGVPILAHSKTAELMKARCDHCLANLRPVLGTELLGTRLVLPSRTIDATTLIDQGGRKLELLHFGWASTPGDVAVFDRTSGVLFAGGLLSVDRVPEICDADFDGWLRALSRLRELRFGLLVPGHGNISGGHAAIEQTETYLRALDGKVKTLYGSGRSLLESVDSGDLQEYAQLPQYDPLHRRNVLHRYLQLEIEAFGGDPRSTALPQQ